MIITSVHTPPVFLSIIKSLFAQVVGKYGCDGCLEIDASNNVYLPVKKCPKCHIENIIRSFKEHSGDLSMNIIETYRNYLNEHDLYAPEEHYTTLRALILQRNKKLLH